MRKSVLIFFILAFSLISTAAADALTLKIPDATGYVGKTVIIPVNIENAK